MLRVYPQAVPPPLLAMLNGYADSVMALDPDQVIGRGTPIDPYMERWHQLRKNPSGAIENIYLHRFVRSDHEDLHDHPWGNTSIVLRGRYVEDVWSLSGRHRETRNAGDVVMRGSIDRHAIVDVEPGTVTLFITGPKIREWGFWMDGSFVHWRDYRAIKKRQPQDWREDVITEHMGERA